MRILRANQVSPLQNWYPIIYIHNDIINSVRYVDLGEARQRTYEMLFNVYAYCDAIIFGMLCRFGRGTPRTYEASIRCYSKKNRRCGQRALRRIIKKMRDAHFAGESGFAPTELVSNNLYT